MMCYICSRNGLRMNGLNLAIKEMKTEKKTFKFTGTLKYIKLEF